MDKSAKAPASAATPRKPFKEMNRKEKAVFVLQAVVCVCTFCFAFPNLFD